MLDILVVDDEPAVRMSVAKALCDAGHRVTEAEDGERALAHVVSRVFDVAIFDVRLPKVDGLTLFRRLRVESPGTVAILMTAYGSVRDAVEALRAGAHDYVTKPFDPDDLVTRIIGPIAERRALRQEFEEARARLTARDVGADFVGSSPFAARIRAGITSAAQSSAPLLIRGERGTGKRLVARIVHERSPRRAEPCVAVSCAAFPQETVLGELFGYGRGAFPGATHAHAGCFAAANGGTLLLDDIGALPLPGQARLLAMLRDGTITAVGSHEHVAIDVRVIATSHEDLERRVTEGTFREDLLRKLRVLELSLIPLRERATDLPVLFEYFSQRHARGVPPKIAPSAWAELSSYPFPGNVDELSDVIKHALAAARGSVIDVQHLPAAIVRSGAEEHPPARKHSGTRTRVVAPLDELARSDSDPQQEPKLRH
jgi:DNA-binding NtrC family response regulator